MENEELVLDVGELIEYIANKLDLDEDLVEAVLDCEDEYMAENGFYEVEYDDDDDDDIEDDDIEE